MPSVTIREDQMNAFAGQMRQQFENRMVDHLRSAFPDHELTQDADSLRGFVRTGIDTAEGYGVTLEDDIRRYLEYMMVLSPDYDRDPKTEWAGRILRDPNFASTEKMERIDNTYVFSRKWS